MKFANTFGNNQNMECGLIRIIKINDWEQKPVPVPLTKVDVEASVVHAVAQVRITQVFKNLEEQPIEAIYYFPVDPNGAVTHFEAEIEGRKIKGVVKKTEEAKEEYEKAIENHQTAFLGSENKADIFKLNVGFLKPGVEAKVIIGYTTEVKNEKGSDTMRFYLPTTVAPRYVPDRDQSEEAKDLRNMKFSPDSPAPLHIRVFASLQGEIEAVESPTHKIVVKEKSAIADKPNWTKAVVELEGTTTDMDRDFVLLMKPKEKQRPRVYVEKLQDSVAFMAHFIPSFKLADQKVELIFLLDRSGSMQGESIQQAKKALLLFLHSLPVDCYFNIVGFGSSHQFLFPKSAKYDDNSLKAAVEHAKKLDADLGGTEIFEPLKQIFTLEPVRGYLRQLFVLTDGEVGNTGEVIGLTKANAHETRVFALGIGDGASHHLVDGLAEAGNGTSAFVTYNESVDKKVLNQLKDAIQPSLTDGKLEWEGMGEVAETVIPAPVCTEKTMDGYGKPVKVDGVEAKPEKRFLQVPEKIPPIFDGSQLLVFGIFRNPADLPKKMKLIGESPDGPLTMNIDIDHTNEVGATGMIHKLAAAKMIRDLEMKIDGLGIGTWRPNGDSEQDKALEAKYKNEATALAVREGITSRFTSFVAVDTSDNKHSENWAMQTRHVSSQLAHGWHGYQAAPVAMMAKSRSARCAPMGISVFDRSSRSTGGLFGSSASNNSFSFGPQRQQASALSFGSSANYMPVQHSLFSFPQIESFSSSSPGTGSIAQAPPNSGFVFGSSSGGSTTSSHFASTSNTFGVSSALNASQQQPLGRMTRLCMMQGVEPQQNFLSSASVIDSVLFEEMDCSVPKPQVDDDQHSDSSSSSDEPQRKVSLRSLQLNELESIITRQSFDGSYSWSEELLRLIHLDPTVAETEAKKNNWDLKAFVSTLVLAYLNAKLADKKDSWELAAMKTSKWIQANHGASAEAMDNAAKKYF